jgi:hypothetical protein
MMVSILLAPVLIGVGAANVRDDARGRAILRASWIGYAVLWVGLLYFLRSRWL